MTINNYEQKRKKNKMINFIKKMFSVSSNEVNTEKKLDVKFNIDPVLRKLYEANGEREVVLSAEEAGELFDYLDYVGWVTSQPKKQNFAGEAKWLGS